MHCLEVIVARNERAAAREEAHALLDGNNELHRRIATNPDNESTVNYVNAYVRAVKEDK
jgi:hypothetical protein